MEKRTDSPAGGGRPDPLGVYQRVFTREAAERGGAEYWQDWYCEPPAPGIAYQVIREEWSDDPGELMAAAGKPVRKILEVRVLP